MTIKIKHKRGTASAITSANPTLSAGELAFETDTRRFKVGDGTTAWSSLNYVTPYVTATNTLLGRSSSGAGAAEEISCTSYARTILDDSDAATARATLGVTIGTHVQAYDAELAALAGVTSAADALPYFTGSGTATTTTLSSFGRSLIDDADAAAARTTLSVQPTASPAFTGTVTCGDTVNIGTASTTNTIVNVGNGATGNRFALIDLIGDATYTDYGLRIGRDNGGANGQSIIHHRGTGELAIVAIDAGSVQIGTNSQTRLTVSSAGVSTFSGQLLVTAGSASAPGVAFGPSDTNTGMWSPSADVLAFSTAGAERVRIDASGRVGIGVTPASAGSSAMQVRGDLDIFGNGSDRSITYNVGVGDDGITGWYRSKIAFIPSGAANNISQHISFFNKDGDNGGATLTERMRIANDGKIYGYSVYATTVGATNRDLFIDSGGLIGYVSSIRASKTDIESIDDVSWLRDLTPVSFRYRRRNEDGTYSDEPDGTRDYGLIAEDVEPVAPEMCFYDMVDGEPQLRGVHYSKLITPMLRYIQQLEARIAALEEMINA